jgi:hypothetical protein
MGDQGPRGRICWRLQLVAGAGHAALTEAPEVTADLVMEFLQS